MRRSCGVYQKNSESPKLFSRSTTASWSAMQWVWIFQHPGALCMYAVYRVKVLMVLMSFPPSLRFFMVMGYIFLFDLLNSVGVVSLNVWRRCVYFPAIGHVVLGGGIVSLVIVLLVLLLELMGLFEFVLVLLVLLGASGEYLFLVGIGFGAFATYCFGLHVRLAGSYRTSAAKSAIVSVWVSLGCVFVCSACVVSMLVVL